MLHQSSKLVFTIDNSKGVKSNYSMTAQLSENHLLIIEDDQGHKEYILDRSIYSIGRDKGCDIRLISQFVSRRHATLVRMQKLDDSSGYYYRIVDGDAKGKPSSNGFLIKGRRIAAHDLTHEDVVIFGPGVQATYLLLQTETTSEIDGLTLIDPGMIDEGEMV